MPKKKTKTSNPFDNKLLRNPGQYLEEGMLDEIIRMVDHFLIICFAVLIPAQLAWAHFHPPALSSAIISAIIAAPVIIWSSLKIIKSYQRFKNNVLGRDGERYVSQILHKEKEKEWRIFDDVQMGGYNIDHLLIAPQGIFCIETKVRKRKDNRMKKIVYNGKTLKIDDFVYHPNNPKSPIYQVMLTSKNLESSLKLLLGKSFLVKPVLVFPITSVTNKLHNKPNDDCWVMNPEQLPAIIRNSPVILKPQEKNKICSVVEKYVRSYKEKL
jgi:hypothetical protein